MGFDRLFVLGVYLRGFVLVFLHVAMVSVLVVWLLQVGAMFFGETYDWGQILVHIFLSLCLLAFFPGQTAWTYRISDRHGRLYTIVGDENAPDTRDER